MPAWVLPAAMGAVGLGQGLLQQHQQGKENMKLAQFQASANERYLDKQLEYNTPKNQMQRYQDAGLNPNLIYGQGNPGNQSAPLQHPEIKPRDFSSLMNMAQMANQTKMVNSQVQAQDANTQKSVAQAELTRLQSIIAQKNPLLNAGSYNAIISSLISTADIKASEATTKGIESQWFSKRKSRQTSDGGLGFQIEQGTNGAFKMEAELNNLEQKFKLGNADQKIKAEILENKEFQNAIMEVQKRFMTDGDITPQHIVTFIQLLLMKLL